MSGSKKKFYNDLLHDLFNSKSNQKDVKLKLDASKLVSTRAGYERSEYILRGDKLYAIPNTHGKSRVNHPRAIPGTPEGVKMQNMLTNHAGAAGGSEPPVVSSTTLNRMPPMVKIPPSRSSPVQRGMLIPPRVIISAPGEVPPADIFTRSYTARGPPEPRRPMRPPVGNYFSKIPPLVVVSAPDEMPPPLIFSGKDVDLYHENCGVCAHNAFPSRHNSMEGFRSRNDLLVPGTADMLSGREISRRLTISDGDSTERSLNGRQFQEKICETAATGEGKPAEMPSWATVSDEEIGEAAATPEEEDPAEEPRSAAISGQKGAF